MNIIKFRARPRVFTDREAFVDAVRDEVFRSQMRYKDIALDAGVTLQTISNLATGKTAWPRPATLFGVVKALGLAIRLERR